MPYETNFDLPPRVRDHLPAHAQDIFRAAFNAAWRQYSGDEEIANRVAWSAVKKTYEKRGPHWVAKSKSM
jgi:cation transport regulator